MPKAIILDGMTLCDVNCLVVYGTDNVPEDAFDVPQEFIDRYNAMLREYHEVQAQLAQYAKIHGSL